MNKLPLLLVVDDHPVVLKGLEMMLTQAGYGVITADSAETAVSSAGKNPAVRAYIIDMSINDMADGLELAKTLRQEYKDCPTVIYTMHDELWNISALQDSGVEGIVLKSDDLTEITKAVEAVINGDKYFSESFRKGCADLENHEKLLSPLDSEILSDISIGMTNKDIAGKCNISEKSVEYHRKNIMKKLSVKNINEAVRLAVKTGIINAICMLLFPSALMAQEQTGISAPQPVDLGLSVLWADRNLGAEDPLDSGMFFAFGETSPKDIYNWDTYLHCDDGDMFMCHDFGTDDISGTQYDAACVLLGDGWRLPTVGEAMELMETATFSLCSTQIDDPVQYVLVSTPSGEIRMPACGYMSEGRIVHLDNWIYWTSMCEYEEEYVEEEDFTFSYLGPYCFGCVVKEPLSPILMYGSAHLGLPIRPVRDRDTGVSSLPGENGEAIGVYSLDGHLISKTLSDTLPAGIYIIRFADGSTKKVRF